MTYSDNGQSGKMLLSVQIIADFMDEASWSFLAQVQGDQGRLEGCRIFDPSEQLCPEIIYILPEGSADSFPKDEYSYVTSENLSGAAPHIRSVRRSFHEIVNLVMNMFQTFHDFEMRLNEIVRSGGSLTDLCRAGELFFRNPMFIHDNMFALTGLPKDIETTNQFDHNPGSGVYHIPMHRIDEFRFDPQYLATLEEHHANIWDNRAYPNGFRSLYVNLWDGDHYYGRLLINERNTALKPGQLIAADFFAEYAVMIIRRNTGALQPSYRSFEDTIVGLATGKEVAEEDLSTMLNILQWKHNERFLCLRLTNQDSESPISPVSAVRSALSTELDHYLSFFYENDLCFLVNMSQTSMNPGQICRRIAPYVRDNCLFCGVSNPFTNLSLLPGAFRQAAGALKYAAGSRGKSWIVPFQECAMFYIESYAASVFPPELIIAPQIIKLRNYDQEHGTEYYQTLRAWLFHERDIPKTAAALIIHRTTLTYRLSKLKEIVPVDLNDDTERLYLLLSYHLLDNVQPK